MHRSVDRIKSELRKRDSSLRKLLSICVLVALFIFPTLARNANAEESDNSSEVANSSSINNSVTTLLDRVKQSHIDARPLVVLESVSDEKLKELQELLIKFDSINSVSAIQAPTYASDELAVKLVPLYYRSGAVEVIWLELKNVEREWLVSKIETIPLDDSIERLIAFREKHPDATSVAYVHEQSPEPKKVASVIDRKRWDEAAELAIKYARENPPKPINRRPESLRSLELTPEKINELLAGKWNPEIVKYLGPYASETIFAGMRSKTPETRRDAVHSLWSRPVTQWNMQILVQMEEMLASDPDPRVRVEVVFMLNKLDTETAVSMLLGPALADLNSQVFNAAMSHLEHRKDPRAFAPLLTQLAMETDWQRQHKIATTLLSCDQAKAWPHVMKLALNEDSDGRGFQLIVYASRNWQDSETTYFWPWPFELRELERTVLNSTTVAGENFGQEEIDQLINYIADKNSDPALKSDCRRALIALHPTDTKRLIQLARDHQDEINSFHRVLAAIPTEESVRFLTNEFLASEEKQRSVLLDDYQTSGRWQVPLLMVLLDDPSLASEVAFNPIGRHPSSYSETYSTNRAHQALTMVFQNEGFEIPLTNVLREKFDLASEIAGLKIWWREHGDAFMANKEVPMPKISIVMYSY